MQLYKEYSKSSTSTTFQEVVNCLADAKPFYGTKLLSDLQPGFVFLIKMFISDKSATKLWKRRRHSSLTILDIIPYIWKSQNLWAVFLKSECILHIICSMLDGCCDCVDKCLLNISIFWNQRYQQGWFCTYTADPCFILQTDIVELCLTEFHNVQDLATNTNKHNSHI